MNLFMITGKVKEIRIQTSALERKFLVLEIESKSKEKGFTELFEISILYDQLFNARPLEIGDNVMVKGKIISHRIKGISKKAHLSYELRADSITKY